MSLRAGGVLFVSMDKDELSVLHSLLCQHEGTRRSRCSKLQNFMGEMNPPTKQLRKTHHVVLLNGLCLHFMNHLILFCDESRGKDDKSAATIVSNAADLSWRLDHLACKAGRNVFTVPAVCYTLYLTVQ
ncbi:hypothetical protein Q9966_004211 [Columba livia]|nr:hypothetical protein Q9966_004211 [Columba livia]